MDSTNRRWQNHLKAKGLIPFLLDRLQSHALSSSWQFGQGAFYFPIKDRELDDELTKAYFSMTEHFPYEFYIEITNTCNLRCSMCARPSMKRATGIMDDKLFTKIIDEIAKKQPYAYLHYYGIGESLLDPSLFEKLEYAKSKDICNSILFSNGQLLLKNDNYKKLADSKVAVIGVDLDGFSKETYEKIRVGGDFETVKRGIEKLYEYVRTKNLNTRIEIAYQIYPKLNEDEISPFIAWCNASAYEYKLVTLHGWAGLRDDLPSSNTEGLAAQHHVKRTGACSSLMSSLVIGWDGRVALCFQDADMQEVLGNIAETSIQEVWEGSHLQKRLQHLSGKFTGLCEKCTSFTAVNLPQQGSRLYPLSLRDSSVE